MRGTTSMKANSAVPRIRGIEGLGYRSDLDTVEIGFAVEGAEPIQLRCGVACVQEIVNRLSALLQHLEAQLPSPQSNAATYASTVLKTEARAAKGGEVVLLWLYADSGAAQLFALSPEASAKLRPQLDAAEQQAQTVRRRLPHL
jgi:hypothetical protein